MHMCLLFSGCANQSLNENDQIILADKENPTQVITLRFFAQMGTNINNDALYYQELIKLYLTEFGLAVDTAASGEQAVEVALANAPYDLVMLDWKLPGIDGEEAAWRIKSAGISQPRFVLITAYDASVAERDTSRQKFGLILQKPIFKSALCQKLSMLFSAQESDSAEVQDVFEGRRFLLVEDNALNREIATELFTLSGAAAESAVDGQAGVESFLAREPGYYDAIFMDIQMPNMNGYEATKRIRSSGHPQARDIPIIAMSANVFAEDIRASKDAGMNAHLGKPIVMADIYRVLQELLR